MYSTFLINHHKLTSATFECSIGEGDHGHRGSKPDGPGNPINISGEKGKPPLLADNTLSLTPNVDMVNAIKEEQSRLKSIAVFFVCMDVKFLLARKYLDDWINNVWGKKLGIVVNFSRMIQKGLFVIFFKNHAMQEKVFKKKIWNIGQTMFRAFPWSLKGKIEDVAQ